MPSENFCWVFWDWIEIDDYGKQEFVLEEEEWLTFLE